MPTLLTRLAFASVAIIALSAHAGCAGHSWPGGIQARLVWSPSEGVRVLDTTPEGPADRAGVLAGDRLIAIEGEPVVGLPAQAVHELLEGEVGSWVQITVDRSGEWVQLRVERTPYGRS